MKLVSFIKSVVQYPSGPYQPLVFPSQLKLVNQEDHGQSSADATLRCSNGGADSGRGSALNGGMGPLSPLSLATSHHLQKLPTDQPPTFLLPTFSSRRRPLRRFHFSKETDGFEDKRSW